LISRYRTILESAHVFAGVLLVLALAVAFNLLIRLIERRAAVWQTGTAAGRDAIAREIPATGLQPANS
jgi:NitT/TauT family transport system permease protein